MKTNRMTIVISNRYDFWTPMYVLLCSTKESHIYVFDLMISDDRFYST